MTPSSPCALPPLPTPAQHPKHAAGGWPPELYLVTSTSGTPPPPCSAATARRVERAGGTLASQAVARLNARVWFAAIPPQVRATAGLIAQDGIRVFARWLRHPQDNVEAATAVFTGAPRTPRG
jgi:hypothetical protein